MHMLERPLPKLVSMDDPISTGPPQPQLFEVGTGKFVKHGGKAVQLQVSGFSLFSIDSNGAKVEHMPKIDDSLYQANIEILTFKSKHLEVETNLQEMSGGDKILVERSLACSSASSKQSTESYLQKKN